MFAKGARRDPTHLRTQYDARHHPAVRAGLRLGVKGAADLTSYEPARKNQGQAGACTAAAGAGAISTACRAAGTALPFEPSERELYATTRAVARGRDSSEELQPLTDSGAFPADVMTALAHYGVCPQAGNSLDQRNFDIWTAADTGGPSNVNDEPDTSQLQQAAMSIVTGEYRIQESAGDVIDQVCAALDGGFPIYVCTFVDSAFEGWSPDQPPIGAPDQSDPQGGGHAIYISAYYTNNGSRVFTVTNSWGTSWGDNGRCLVSEAWVRAAWDLYVMDVRVQKAVT